MTVGYRDGSWHDFPGAGDPLAITIQDSDIATIDYAPSDAVGRFHLGFQPRDYFEDPDASRPVDVEAEVDGFLGWAEHTLGRAPHPEDILELVAEDGLDEPDDEFVEDTAARLLALLGLPLPPALAEVTG